MNAIARSRYARYASRVPGTGEPVKSSNGAKNLTVEARSFTRCCRWKKSTLPNPVARVELTERAPSRLPEPPRQEPAGVAAEHLPQERRATRGVHLLEARTDALRSG